MSDPEIKALKAIIEAILFASGEPVELSRIAEAVGADLKRTEESLELLRSEYAAEEHGIRIIRLEKSWQMVTAPEMYDYVYSVTDSGRKQPLSQAGYEVLSVIAYKQPVTRAVIEKIRGVNSDSAINKLIERGLIHEAGRLDAPGRPAIYATTAEFLRSFGYSDLSELPPIE